MAGMPQIQPSTACRCLNVRICPQLHPDNPPDFLIAAAGDSEYTLTYVGDKGISIAYPQVTMRTRRIGPPIADSPRCIRYTTLTCLLCQTVAYRVQQLVACDEDLQEGPLLPSVDWVEQETLMSCSGWIEVHKDCLLTEDVTRLLASSTYSTTFGIALPQNTITTATPTQPASHQESRAQTTPPAGLFLRNLNPLFPPAPFVPSHPVFTHLSSIAVNASEHLRSLAEEQIAAIVRDKFAELEEVDDRLRHDVEELWRKFVENLGEAEKQIGPRVGETRKRDTSRGLSVSTSGVSGTPVVSVRDFVPTPTTAPRVMSPSSSRSRVSSLSASLATPGFHHVRAVQEPTEARERSPSGSPRSPPPYSSHPSSLGSAEGLISSSLESSPVLSPRPNGDSILQPFKRSMDEARDTAVSFRYFRILEADVARARQQQPNAESETAAKVGEPAKETGDSSAAKVTSPVKGAEAVQVHPPEGSDRDVKPPPTDGTPRKRKVKFDVTATEAVSSEEGTSLRANGESGENEEMIFDFEDASSKPESSDAVPILPFIENAQARRRGRHRVASLGVLPESLSSLRPTSLPAYSALRSRDTEGPATSVSISSTTQPVLLLQEASSEYPEQLDSQEEEILKLVAANTPSHRNAWKRNSKAWQLFVSRRRNGVPGALIPEETEDGLGRASDDADDSNFGASRDVRWSLGNAGFAASLPVDISPLSRRREPLSLASYHPKTLVPDQAGAMVPVFPDGRRHSSSTTLRRASYAERDRSKAIDPGALDFVAGNGEVAEDDESDEGPSKVNLSDEGRGRQRAFKILQARSKIPEAGMWMSLA